MNKNLSKRLLQPVIAGIGALSGEALVKRLWSEGLLDVRALERRAIRLDVERRVRAGEGRCRAMDAVACDFCCSYEKVREIVYNKRKS